MTNHRLPERRTLPTDWGRWSVSRPRGATIAPGNAIIAAWGRGRKGSPTNPVRATEMPNDEFEYIFVRFVTTRSGKRIYAASKGLRAFRIRVRRRRGK
jgi:hypothetical protein